MVWIPFQRLSRLRMQILQRLSHWEFKSMTESKTEQQPDAWNEFRKIINSGQMKEGFKKGFNDNYVQNRGPMPQPQKLFVGGAYIDVSSTGTASQIATAAIKTMQELGKKVALERSQLASFKPISSSYLQHSTDLLFFRCDNVIITFRKPIDTCKKVYFVTYMFMGV
jgi:hypothetical protein